MLCCRYSSGPEPVLKGRLGTPGTSARPRGQARSSRRGVIVPGGNGGSRSRRLGEFLSKQAAALKAVDTVSGTQRPVHLRPHGHFRTPTGGGPAHTGYPGPAHALATPTAVGSAVKTVKSGVLARGFRRTILKLPAFPYTELDRNQRQRRKKL